MPGGRTSPRYWRMTSLVMLIYVYLLMSRVHVDAGMCSRSSCLNGGRMIMPNSVFGYCRCRCPDHFSGPKCQFVSKRVVDAVTRPTTDAATASIMNSNDNDELVFTPPPSLQQIINQLHGKQRVRDSLTAFHVD